MNSIGELNEKAIHHHAKMVVSNGNVDLQEIRVGNYIADIKIGNDIKEIQTTNFKNLVRKIKFYISQGYNVEVIYPLINKSQIIYMNRVTGYEDYRGKKHTYKTKYDALKEMYWLEQFIDNDSFSLRILLYEVQDYRYSDNKQKINKYPASIIEEVLIQNSNDLWKFIPNTLNKKFLAKEFKREAKTRSKYYHQYLHLLENFGVVSTIGKQGHAVVWQVNDIIK